MAFNPICHFTLGKNHYRHEIDTSNDEIRLVNEFTEEVELIYSATGPIYSPDGKVGDYCLEGYYWVIYENPNRDRVIVHPKIGRQPPLYREPLIEAEVLFSKYWLTSRMQSELADFRFWAQEAVNRWEKGDLAEAIRELSRILGAA